MSNCTQNQDNVTSAFSITEYTNNVAKFFKYNLYASYVDQGL
jgi:hypothetical protein